MNLDPLRTAIRAQAEAEAERHRAEVEAERERALAEARSEADALVERARLEGRRAGVHEGARRRGAARRRAREELLRARGSLFEELRHRARAEVPALRSDPAYPRLVERLEDAARRQLGADAEIVADRPATGGVSASSGQRSVDYTLAALVDRTIDDLNGEVSGLWR
jgi:vacuolar-type H+-ATPase subunit E/Vma4